MSVAEEAHERGEAERAKQRWTSTITLDIEVNVRGDDYVEALQRVALVKQWLDGRLPGLRVFGIDAESMSVVGSAFSTPEETW